MTTQTKLDADQLALIELWLRDYMGDAEPMRDLTSQDMRAVGAFMSALEKAGDLTQPDFELLLRGVCEKTRGRILTARPQDLVETAIGTLGFLAGVARRKLQAEPQATEQLLVTIAMYQMTLLNAAFGDSAFEQLVEKLQRDFDAAAQDAADDNDEQAEGA